MPFGIFHVFIAIYLQWSGPYAWIHILLHPKHHIKASQEVLFSEESGSIGQIVDRFRIGFSEPAVLSSPLKFALALMKNESGNS